MKQFLFFLLAMSLLMSSCHKEYPETPLDGNNKLSENTVEGKSDNHLAELKKEDLIFYFGFDKTKEVDKALQAINTIKGEKEINNRKINITSVIAYDVSEIDGGFSLKIKASVNGVNLIGNYIFDGFKKTHPALSDYYIGLRGYGDWKVAPEAYLKDFKFEDLYLYNKVENFTAQYLKQYVVFYASDPDGKQYEMTEKQVNGLKIHGMKYLNNEIRFKTIYSNVESEVETKLAFNITEYYSLRVGVLKNFAKNKYMRGVHEHLDYFIHWALDFDKDIYGAYLTSKIQSDSKNSLDFSFYLEHKENDILRVEITKELKGFKPLSDLKNELSVTSSLELETFLQKNLKGKTQEQVLEYLKAVPKWTHFLRFKLLRNNKLIDVFWDKKDFKSIFGENEIRDFYLERPSFSAHSARYDGNDLIIRFQLDGANDVVLSGITFEVKAVGVKIKQ